MRGMLIRLSRDAEDSPHVYNQRRDIWDAGIIMLQMLFGVDVVTQYPAIWNAVDALVARKPPETS